MTQPEPIETTSERLTAEELEHFEIDQLIGKLLAAKKEYERAIDLWRDATHKKDETQAAVSKIECDLGGRLKKLGFGVVHNGVFVHVARPDSLMQEIVIVPCYPRTFSKVPASDD